MKKLIAVLALVGVFMMGSTSCVTTSDGHVKTLEEMTQVEFDNFKLYVQLGVKIGANRLVQERVVTTEELGVAATIIDGIQSKPVTGGARAILVPALQQAGFYQDEVELILLIAENQLWSRGALDWLNPETGVIELSPRTREVISLIADALRTAGTVTQEEQSQATAMRADFCRM